MEQWVLAVGFEKDKCSEMREEWLKYGILPHMAESMPEAILELSNHGHYLLVAIFSENAEYLDSLKIIRGMVKAPVLVVRRGYNGPEKILAIEAGADEYIRWPDSAGESVASGRALIRRYQMPHGDGLPATVLSCGCLLLCVEYRKGFVYGKEAGFTRQEFDFLCLLLNGIGRVYTYGQICGHIWGDESMERGSNALWNLVSRLRAKITEMGGDGKILQTVRDVGYKIERAGTA